MLMHGWINRTRPAGDKLKGEEFRHARDVLAGVNKLDREAKNPKMDRSPTSEPTRLKRNLPLEQSENEKARELVELDDKFILNVGEMPPAAASYVRRHSCLTVEAMKKWRVGVLPQSGGEDKRGWSLRGHLLYPIMSENGKLLCWVSRDPLFEKKEQEFLSLVPERRASERPPSKHRFPVNFHRGVELFGQQSSRLEEAGYRDVIAKYGIIVVEGFNDVIALDALGIPSVAIMSNVMTEEQAAKIERFATSLANGKVLLLLDADPPGDNGAKQALWTLSQKALSVRLGWSREMHSGRFDGREPESLVTDEWQTLVRTFRTSHIDWTE